jgi:hypothetical protein
MRPITAASQARLDALQRRYGFLWQLLGVDTTAEREALEQIAAQPEAALVPQLLWFAFDKSAPTAAAARRALAACLSVATSDELLAIDARCRRSWWYAGNGGWPELGPGDVMRFATATDDTRILGALSFHPNGRIRERAVAHLASRAGGDELPFLLIRLNDWVSEVARRAERAVMRRIVPEYAVALADNLQIVLRLGDMRRRRHDGVIDGVVALLLAPESRSALDRALADADRRVRRLLFRRALGAPGVDTTMLLQRALADEDMPVRLAAVRIARGLSREVIEQLLPTLLRDPSPAVRSEGLTAAVSLDAATADGALFAALLDRAKSVRETARFYLRRQRGFDAFAAFYRERIAEMSGRTRRVRKLTPAIDGLGEVGQRSDLAVLIPYLDDARPALRAAAVRAMALIDFDESAERLVEMLGDPSPSVTRRVRQVLEPRAGSLPPDVLRPLIAETSHVHGRLDALLLARRLGKWDAITLLLEGTRDFTAEVRAGALDGIGRWMASRNASFEQPTRAHLQYLRAALDRSRTALPVAIATELDAIVRYWEGTSPVQSGSIHAS